jgi:hypothetical protein
MSLVNLFITGLASLFVALEPDRTRVTGNFYKNVTKRAILSGFYMFIPVGIALLYVFFSQIARTQAFDPQSLTTVFESGEIVQFGWIPTMALCVTISGFIIFFKNCRPFTTFRKFLYIITLAVVLFILWLAPEFFIVSGTEMVNEVGGFLKIFPYIFSHIVPNLTLSLFKTMTLEQIIFVGVHALVAVPLYLLNEKFGGKLLDLTLFSKREYKDE